MGGGSVPTFRAVPGEILPAGLSLLHVPLRDYVCEYCGSVHEKDRCESCSAPRRKPARQFFAVTQNP